MSQIEKKKKINVVSWCYLLNIGIGENKNDRGNYVTKQAGQVWGRDPPQYFLRSILVHIRP